MAKSIPIQKNPAPVQNPFNPQNVGGFTPIPNAVPGGEGFTPIPNALPGQDDIQPLSTGIPGTPTPTPAPGGQVAAPVVTPTGGGQLLPEPVPFKEGNILYTNDGVNIYKDGVLVPKENLGYIPSAIGGTRDGPSTFNPNAPGYTLTENEITSFEGMDENILKQQALMNSQQWANASPEEKLRLQALNDHIMGNLLGYVFDNSTGTWTNATTGKSLQDEMTDTSGEVVAGPVEGEVLDTQGGAGGLTTETQWTSMLNESISKVWERLNTEFQWDADTDKQFQAAKEMITREITEAMNKRGGLYSSITGDQLAERYISLSAQYEQIARQNYDSHTDKLMAFAGFVSDLDAKEFDKAVALWEVDMQEREFKYTRDMDALQLRIDNEQQEYDRSRQEIQDAWDDVNERGYVSNEMSVILGLEPGTLSQDAQQAIQDRLDEKEDTHTAFTNQMSLISANLAADIAKFDYEFEKEKELLTDADENKNGTAEQRSKLNDLIASFETSTNKDGSIRTSNQILGIIGKSGKDYYVNNFGITGQQYEDMVDYFDNQVINPNEQAPEDSIFNIEGIKTVTTKLDDINKKYSGTTYEKQVAEKVYPHTVKGVTTPYTPEEIVANKEQRELEMITYLDSVAGTFGWSRKQLNELLAVYGLPSIDAIDEKYNSEE